MKIFPTACISHIDAGTIKSEPIASIDLMERAAERLTHAIVKEYPSVGTYFVVVAGCGNNGGDALAVARMLWNMGYGVEVWVMPLRDKLSPDCACNLSRLQQETSVPVNTIDGDTLISVPSDGAVIVDGIFGSGLNRAPQGLYARLIGRINELPNRVVSIDIPSGLMGENALENGCIVRADITLTLQFPKISMLVADSEPYVGRMKIVDIGLDAKTIETTATNYYFTTHADAATLVRPRRRHAHKGNFGRGLLVAGSQGMAGASILSARGALRSGIGLLTVHLPRCNNAIVQASVPEATTSVDASVDCFSQAPDVEKYSAVAVGPGLGTSTTTADALLQLIKKCHVPMVLDADALNIISRNPGWMSLLPSGSVITPHPGEFRRIAGESASCWEAIEKARSMAVRYNVCIVLKGAYTAVVSPQGNVHFNSSGNAGMATGGSGDVLTGIVLSLLAQGYTSTDAARLAVYVHGYAGDCAGGKLGQTALVAGDIINYLPEAWCSLENA